MRRLSILVALLGLLSLGAAGAGGSPVAARRCAIPHAGQHLGPTYLTSLSVSATSCSAGLAVVRDYHACQVRHGGVRARCSGSVDGFHCSERRGPSIPTEFFSSVSCRRHAARVSYNYTQFT